MAGFQQRSAFGAPRLRQLRRRRPWRRRGDGGRPACGPATRPWRRSAWRPAPAVPVGAVGDELVDAAPAGASRLVPRSVPTPQRSIGAPAAPAAAISRSSRSPLATIGVGHPASSSSRAAPRESVSRSPESSRTPRSARPSRERRRSRAHALERVVGVHQHHRVAGRVLHEGPKRLLLVAGRRSRRSAPWCRPAGRSASRRDVGRARPRRRSPPRAPPSSPRRRRGRGAARSPRTSGPARRRQHEARGLGGDRGLEVDLVEQQRLQQLRLDAAP